MQRGVVQAGLAALSVKSSGAHVPSQPCMASVPKDTFVAKSYSSHHPHSLAHWRKKGMERKGATAFRCLCF